MSIETPQLDETQDKPNILASSKNAISEEAKRIVKELNLDIPEEEKKNITTAAVVAALSIRQASFRSPMPPPDLLKGYNEQIPNGADRLLKMVEAQAAHRMDMQNFNLKESHRQSGRGQIMGFVIAIICLSASGILAYLGHDVVAGVIGESTIVSLATIFVLGKIIQSKDTSENKEKKLSKEL